MKKLDGLYQAFVKTMKIYTSLEIIIVLHHVIQSINFQRKHHVSKLKYIFVYALLINYSSQYFNKYAF